MKKSGAAGSLEEVVLFASQIGATEKAARWFWFTQESIGWLNRKSPIKNWRACFQAWWEAKYFPEYCYVIPPPLPTYQCLICKKPWSADSVGGYWQQCDCFKTIHTDSTQTGV